MRSAQRRDVSHFLSRRLVADILSRWRPCGLDVSGLINFTSSDLVTFLHNKNVRVSKTGLLAHVAAEVAAHTGFASAWPGDMKLSDRVVAWRPLLHELSCQQDSTWHPSVPRVDPEGASFYLVVTDRHRRRACVQQVAGVPAAPPLIGLEPESALTICRTQPPAGDAVCVDPPPAFGLFQPNVGPDTNVRIGNIIVPLVSCLATQPQTLDLFERATRVVGPSLIPNGVHQVAVLAVEQAGLIGGGKEKGKGTRKGKEATQVKRSEAEGAAQKAGAAIAANDKAREKREGSAEKRDQERSKRFAATQAKIDGIRPIREMSSALVFALKEQAKRLCRKDQPLLLKVYAGISDQEKEMRNRIAEEDDQWQSRTRRAPHEVLDIPHPDTWDVEVERAVMRMIEAIKDLDTSKGKVVAAADEQEEATPAHSSTSLVKADSADSESGEDDEPESPMVPLRPSRLTHPVPGVNMPAFEPPMEPIDSSSSLPNAAQRPRMVAVIEPKKRVSDGFPQEWKCTYQLSEAKIKLLREMYVGVTVINGKLGHPHPLAHEERNLAEAFTFAQAVRVARKFYDLEEPKICDVGGNWGRQHKRDVFCVAPILDARDVARRPVAARAGECRHAAPGCTHLGDYDMAISVDTLQHLSAEQWADTLDKLKKKEMVHAYYHYPAAFGSYLEGEQRYQLFYDNSVLKVKVHVPGNQEPYVEDAAHWVTQQIPVSRGRSLVCTVLEEFGGRRIVRMQLTSMELPQQVPVKADLAGLISRESGITKWAPTHLVVQGIDRKKPVTEVTLVKSRDAFGILQDEWQVVVPVLMISELASVSVNRPRNADLRKDLTTRCRAWLSSSEFPVAHLPFAIALSVELAMDTNLKFEIACSRDLADVAGRELHAAVMRKETTDGRGSVELAGAIVRSPTMTWLANQIWQPHWRITRAVGSVGQVLMPLIVPEADPLAGLATALVTNSTPSWLISYPVYFVSGFLSGFRGVSLQYEAQWRDSLLKVFNHPQRTMLLVKLHHDRIAMWQRLGVAARVLNLVILLSVTWWGIKQPSSPLHKLWLWLRSWWTDQPVNLHE